jgi:hypothetical protein
MRILVFLQGTIITHRKAGGRTPEEVVEQVLQVDESLHDWTFYIPVGNAAGNLRGWRRQGATTCCLSSHKNAEDVEKDRAVLKKHAFPDGEILYRRSGEEYKDVVERIRPLPDVIVEDDGEPMEFSHTLDDQIGGQLAAGFVITGFYEDRTPPSKEEPLTAYMPNCMATRAIKP